MTFYKLFKLGNFTLSFIQMPCGKYVFIKHQAYDHIGFKIPFSK